MRSKVDKWVARAFWSLVLIYLCTLTYSFASSSETKMAITLVGITVIAGCFMLYLCYLMLEKWYKKHDDFASGLEKKLTHRIKEHEKNEDISFPFISTAFTIYKLLYLVFGVVVAVFGLFISITSVIETSIIYKQTGEAVYTKFNEDVEVGWNADRRFIGVFYKGQPITIKLNDSKEEETTRDSLLQTTSYLKTTHITETETTFINTPTKH